MICMVIIEPARDNIVDMWRGCTSFPYTAATVFTDVVHLKLSADDAGMATAVELMDPFQSVASINRPTKSAA